MGMCFGLLIVAIKPIHRPEVEKGDVCDDFCESESPGSFKRVSKNNSANSKKSCERTDKINDDFSLQQNRVMYDAQKPGIFSGSDYKKQGVNKGEQENTFHCIGKPEVDKDEGDIKTFLNKIFLRDDFRKKLDGEKGIYGNRDIENKKRSGARMVRD